MDPQVIKRRMKTAVRLTKEFVAADDKVGYLKDFRTWRRDVRKWRRFNDRLLVEQRLNEDFDRRFGTDTAAEVPLQEAGVSAEQAAAGNEVYRPFWASDFASAMARIPGPLDDFTFLDIGSGKGKLLLLAADYPFKQIIGVEYAPLLHATAVRNISVYRSERQKCFDIQSVHGDAQTYRYPSGPLVILIFNAFNQDVMKRALANLEQSPALRSDPVYLIYANLRTVEEIGSALDGLTLLAPVSADSRRVILANDLARKHYLAGRRSHRPFGRKPRVARRPPGGG